MSDKTNNQPVRERSMFMSLAPVMFAFFVMGFVDLVGAASNFVGNDLDLSKTEIALFPSLVFFWFLLFSVPTGLVMNKIGRKNTVLISMLVTLGALVIPFFGNGYTLMLIAFSLLGIGNAIMQTSLNPLVTNIIRGEKLASTLTFGQFVKAIASFIAPLIMAWGAAAVLPSFGLSWRIIFPLFAIVNVLAVAVLWATPIKEDAPDKASGIMACLRLLKNPFVLLCFFGIMCHVGIDVGTNTTAPQILSELTGKGIEEVAYATSIYFICRTVGCLAGSGILAVCSPIKFFAVSVACMILAMGGLFLGNHPTIILISVGLIGFGNSNIFSMVFAQALNHVPNYKNEVSGLMIMGLFGGTIFPLAMGFCSDLLHGYIGAVAVMTVGVAYLLIYNFKMKKA